MPCPDSPFLTQQAYYYIDNVALYAIDAGPDQDLTCGVQTNGPILGGAPLPATANATYSWSPQYGLDDPHSPNPQVIRVGGTITYTLTVTINGQPFTDQVTITGSGVCPCDHPYGQNDLATYQATLHNAGNQPYEIGVAGQVTTIDLSQPAYGGQVVFDGIYHVLGPVKFETGEALLRPGTVFYFDTYQSPSALLQPSCHSAVGIDEYASRLYVGKTGTLRLDGATLTSTCEQMWGGVTLLEDAKLYLEPTSESQTLRSVIRDAFVGVMVEGYCSSQSRPEYYLDDADFYNCHFGFLDLAKDQVTTGEGIRGCHFFSAPSAMLAPFASNGTDLYFTETGLILDGSNTSGLALHHNTFDDLIRGAELAGVGTVFEQNTLSSCYAAAVDVGSFVNSSLTTTDVLVHDNQVAVPNSLPISPQLKPGANVIGIEAYNLRGAVPGNQAGTSIRITANQVDGGLADPTGGIEQIGVLVYATNLVDVKSQNILTRLDEGVRLQDVGLPVDPAADVTVADNQMTTTYSAVRIIGDLNTYSNPVIECNTFKRLFKLARSFGDAAEALQFGFNGASVGEAGTVVCGTAHEQVAAAGGGERDFLRAQERVRVARRAG